MLSIASRTDAEIAALTARFARTGRVRVPQFLDASSATALTQMCDETDFRTVFNRGLQHFDMHATQLNALSPNLKRDLAGLIAKGGAEGFQYNYDNFPLYDAARNGDALTPVQQALHALLQGAPFLDLIRTLTATPQIGFADSQVTRYRPGHFLTTHDDDVAGKNRLFAYVLGLSPGWRADWGGVLQFLDHDEDVIEGFTPRFNALALFRVPVTHCVSMVTPFAPRPRYAVTGWLRAGHPA